MPKSIVSFAILFSAFMTIVSCQKELNYLDIEPVDTTGVIVRDSTIVDSTLLLDTAGVSSLYQVVINNLVHPSSSRVYSLQFDAGRTFLNVYKDDTTNANPYDELLLTYQYNTSGYLVSSANAFANPSYQLLINRDAQNHVTNWITINNGKADTLFFTYAEDGRPSPRYQFLC